MPHDFEMTTNLKDELEAFAACFPPPLNMDQLKEVAKGKKPGPPRKKAKLTEEVALPELDWAALMAQGKVAKQTVKQLKAFCEAKGLKKTGKKGDLVARVEEALKE